MENCTIMKMVVFHYGYFRNICSCLTGTVATVGPLMIWFHNISLTFCHSFNSYNITHFNTWTERHSLYNQWFNHPFTYCCSDTSSIHTLLLAHTAGAVKTISSSRGLDIRSNVSDRGVNKSNADKLTDTDVKWMGERLWTDSDCGEKLFRWSFQENSRHVLKSAVRTQRND